MQTILNYYIKFEQSKRIPRTLTRTQLYSVKCTASAFKTLTKECQDAQVQAEILNQV